MDSTVRFCGATVKELRISTVKELRMAWQQAVQRGQVRLIRPVTAVLHRGDGLAVAAVAERVGVSRATV